MAQQGLARESWRAGAELSAVHVFRVEARRALVAFARIRGMVHAHSVI
jgi:hypothetical protein